NRNGDAIGTQALRVELSRHAYSRLFVACPGIKCLKINLSPDSLQPNPLQPDPLKSIRFVRGRAAPVRIRFPGAAEHRARPPFSRLSLSVPTRAPHPEGRLFQLWVLG